MLKSTGPPRQSECGTDRGTRWFEPKAFSRRARMKGHELNNATAQEILQRLPEHEHGGERHRPRCARLRARSGTQPRKWTRRTSTAWMAMTWRSIAGKDAWRPGKGWLSGGCNGCGRRASKLLQQCVSKTAFASAHSYLYIYAFIYPEALDILKFNLCIDRNGAPSAKKRGSCQKAAQQPRRLSSTAARTRTMCSRTAASRAGFVAPGHPKRSCNSSQGLMFLTVADKVGQVHMTCKWVALGAWQKGQYLGTPDITWYACGPIAAPVSAAITWLVRSRVFKGQKVSCDLHILTHSCVTSGTWSPEVEVVISPGLSQLMLQSRVGLLANCREFQR